MKTKLNKKSQGFTIIEVLIVLAIAGIIMLIIFLAVPALQRNSRNTQRRADASHLAGLVNEYAANKGGALPTSFGTGTATGVMDISGEQWAIMTAPTISTSATFPTSNSTMTVNVGFKCNPSTATLVATSPRGFAVSFRVETSGIDTNSCISG